MFREFRPLIPYLRRYRRLYAVGVVCSALSVAFKLAIPYLLGGSIDELRQLELDGGAGSAGALSALARYALMIAGLAVAVCLVRVTSRLLMLGNSRRIAHDLRNRVFDHLLRLSPSFYVRNPTGQIMSRCINDMQNVQGLMGPVILYMLETTMLFGFAFAMMMSINPAVTLIGILPFPLFLWFARRLAIRIQSGYRRSQNSLAEVSAKVDESLSGQLVIKTLTLEDHDRATFHEHCSEYRGINLSIARQRAVLIPMMTALASISTIVVLGVGGPQVARGEATVGELVALFFYLNMLASPARTLGFVISSMRRGAAALGRIWEIVDSEVGLEDPPTGSAPPAVRGELEVRDLSVVYPPLAEQPHLSGSLPQVDGHVAGAQDDVERRVLDHVSFRVPAGTTLGIVGHTGAGKTTLVRALARQLEIEPGHVFVDGVDVTELPLDALRRSIGFVPQDAFLFSRSLADNVALGAPGASREEIDTAVEAAQLAKDLVQLPQGLDTTVGERGVNLSGGQRQRTALARVLLLAPRILILDDTLSAVDTHTADEILAHLRPFARERTTIIVAHRLSTLAHADHILVLEEGRVVEEGTHAELLAAGGGYARLWAIQEQREAREARAEELGIGLDEEALP